MADPNSAALRSLHAGDHWSAACAFQAVLAERHGDAAAAQGHAMAVHALLSAGFERQRAGDTAGAERQYRRVLACQPDHPDGLHLLGLLERWSGRGAAALGLLVRAARVQPLAAATCCNLGQHRLGVGDGEGALAAFRLAVVAEPGNGEAYTRLGSTLLYLGRENPDAPVALTRIDQDLYRAGTAALRRAARLVSDSAPVWTGLAFGLRMLRRVDEARACYRRVLALQPGVAEQYYEMADLLHFNGRFQDAMRPYKAVLLLLGEREDCRYSFKAAVSATLATGVAAHREGACAEAGRLYRSVAALIPAAAAPLREVQALADSGTPLPDSVHPVFDAFERTPEHFAGEYAVNFMGARCRTSFDKELKYYHPHELASGGSQIIVGRDLPILPSEDCFEWIDLLQAVEEAGERFLFLELGAGYGRWLAHAAAAVRRRKRPGLRSWRLVGVEADRGKLERMRQNLLDNEVDPACCRLLYGAVADADGEMFFPEDSGSHNFGAAAVDSGDAGMTGVPAMRLQTILEAEEGLVDLIDMDIQGAELAVVREAIPVLNARVKRLHVATHGHAIETELAAFLAGQGWRLQMLLPCQSEVPAETPYGPLCCNDGIQSWLNPRLAGGAGR